MKLIVVSDLHLEFADIRLKNTENADVLVLSGDILVARALKRLQRCEDEDMPLEINPGNMEGILYRQFLGRMCDEFPHVIFVMGNHEHYHGNIDETADIIRRDVDDLSNLHFLDDEAVDIDGVRFLGTTLWTDANNNCPHTKWRLASRHHGLNDYDVIRVAKDEYRRIRPDDTIAMHIKARDFISNNIRKGMPNVVVGHHGPTTKSLDEKYIAHREINGGFASELGWFILNHPEIVLWTHGHVHCSKDYMVGDTRVYCNPRGYNNQNKDFKKDEVIEI